MASRSTRVFSASETLVLLDDDELFDEEIGIVDLDGESEDGEQATGNFEGSDGTQSLVPDVYLSSNSTTLIHSLAQENTDPSQRLLITV